jgi:hypothetical protein
MKRWILGAVMFCLILTAVPSWAQIVNPAAATEERYAYSGVKTSDAVIKTGPGLLHALTCGSDAAATAGTLDIRDATAAGGGTIIATLTFVAAYFPPVTLIFDTLFSSGLVLDFTTTADVSCTASYR